jgi:hypothetical protein
VAKSFDPTNASKYGQKGADIVVAMSDPNHQIIDGNPIYSRDDGYGIRFYGTTMGIGYDWFHEFLTAAQQTQIVTQLNLWISNWEDPNFPGAFEYDHVLGNYYAGYYAAKCFSALAVQGDNLLGDTWWNTWLNHEHLQRVVPYYSLNMAGGGWPEGFANYGPLSTRNMALPMLAVRTAKGLDLIHGAQPFPFPLDQARWIMNFTWPSRDMIDDRDGAHSNSLADQVWPGTGEPNTYSFLAGYLAMWNDPLAPAMHKYARDAKTALTNLDPNEDSGSTDEWIEFLFWDNNAPEADYTTSATSFGLVQRGYVDEFPYRPVHQQSGCGTSGVRFRFAGAGSRQERAAGERGGLDHAQSQRRPRGKCPVRRSVWQLGSRPHRGQPPIGQHLPGAPRQRVGHAAARIRAVVVDPRGWRAHAPGTL